MRRAYLCTFTALTGLICSGTAMAQLASFTNQTGTRVSADPSVSTADGMERDWCVGDFDHDGDTDMYVGRKVPYSLPGGRRSVLFMNVAGVLTDQTSTFATASDTAGSTGMLDATNTRDCVAIDVNNDGWLDIVTTQTISDGLPKHIGHPRVYINLGSSGGSWLGFRFESARIPAMLTVGGGSGSNPRFCGMAAGDVTGDGYADLYFTDYDTGEVGPAESAANDFNNRLLVNKGLADPGVFADESTARMGPLTGTWLGGSTGSFGIAAVIADFNNDGGNDIARVLTLAGPSLHIGIAYNTPANTGMFTTQPYHTAYTGQPYGLSLADLNHDGRIDIVFADDGTDRVGRNTGTTLVSGFPVATWSFTSLGAQSNGFQGEETVVDLNNDGWDDFLISDVDEDTYYSSNCIAARRTYIYRNNSGASFTTDDCGLSPTEDLKYLHDVAALDINGDCWMDLVTFQTKNPAGSCGAGDTLGGEVGQMKVFINNAPGGSACPPPPCPTDLNGSGCTSGVDLAALLAAWTGKSTYAGCPGTFVAADFNHDCKVNGLDLAGQLAAWGPCPGVVGCIP